MSDNPSCIDISHWQGFPDFKKVASAGVVAMIHKATEGTGYVDPNRVTNIKNAQENGIACATYHWLKPGGAKAQIEYYLKTISPIEGERVVIDYEEEGCTIQDLHDAVQAILDSPLKLKITVYSGGLLKEQLGATHDAFLADNTDLWLAQYTAGQPSWPTGTYSKWALWQYSENGAVNGIPGTAVDLDQFNGSNTDLIKWISPSVPAVVAQTPTVPVPEITIAIIGVPANTKVNVMIDGKMV